MKRYAAKWRVVAWTLAFVAGFVDVQAFLSFGGYFVSFLSGNSTRFGVALVNGNESAARLCGIIASFVVGVAVSSVCEAIPARWRQSAMLSFATAMLVSSALCQRSGYSYIEIALLAVSMGAINGVFVDGRQVTIGVTYMTGTLVKLGQRLGASIRGEPLRDALPYLVHWGGLVLGGVAGTFAFRRHFANALFIPIAITATLAVVVAWFTQNERDDARPLAGEAIVTQLKTGGHYEQ